MVAIYIHKKIGLKHHLLCKPNGDLQEVEGELPEDALVYNDTSFLEVSKLYSLPLPSFPPPRHLKALQTALNSQDVSEVPWHLAMPPKAFNEAVKALGKQLGEVYANIDLSYYREHYKSADEVLSVMQPAKIDRRAWMVHSSDRKLITPHIFSTFQPNPEGYARKVKYSRCDTRTGRLTVMEGPNILLLPSVQHNILSSRFGFAGRIVYLDYSSLEPRVALTLSNFPVIKGPSPPLSGYLPHPCLNEKGKDLYASIMKELGITDVPRDLVKSVVISQLYGASYATIMGTLDGIPNAAGLVAAIEEFFALKALRAKILNQHDANGQQFIENYYGRKVDTKNANAYMLLNYFIQSTAVDVVMYGFRNILRHIKGIPEIVPLFVLHDALILDVHQSKLPLMEELCDIGSKNIPLFPAEACFPLKWSFK